MQIIKDRNIGKSVIVTDSKSVLLNINNPNLRLSTQNTIFQIKSLLHSLQKGNKLISLWWVPGHCNIEGNEIADTLAKEGRNKRLSDINLDYVEYVKII